MLPSVGKIASIYSATCSAVSSVATQEISLQELEWLLEGFDLWAHRPHKSLQYQSVT